MKEYFCIASKFAGIFNFVAKRAQVVFITIEYLMKQLIVPILLLISLNLNAQKTILLLKDNGKNVSEMDSADYVREINRLDTNKYELKEYYKNGNLKRAGVVTSYKPNLSFDGAVVSYYKSGGKEEDKFYVKGEPIGEARVFYPNGKLKKELVYFKKGKDLSDFSEMPCRLINYYDSLGTPKVKDGNGVYLWSDSVSTEQGKYVNGFKDSVWTEGDIKTGLVYEILFNNGEFISGKVRDSKTGKIKRNFVEQKDPMYPGGVMRFRKVLAKRYIIPKEAFKNHVSGRIILSFVIEKDGTLSDVEILRGLGFGTGEEAERALKSLKKWSPGELYGRPVRVSYTVPITITTP